MEVTDDRLQIILKREMRERGLVGHHIDSMNEFQRQGISQITRHTFKLEVEERSDRDKTEEDRTIQKVYIKVDVDDVRLYKPTTIARGPGNTVDLTPAMARELDRTYSSPIHIDATITAIAYKHDGTTETRTATVKDFKIGALPTMVGSIMCHTYNKGQMALKEMGEDPHDNGGYFVIKGQEWVINGIESRKYNGFNTYYNLGYENEVVRGEMISKPGDAFENSNEVIIRMLTDGSLTSEMVTQWTYSNGSEIQFPFYVIFRALGLSSDRDMIRHITYGESGDIVVGMQETLERAMRVSYKHLPAAAKIYDQFKMLKYIGRHIDNYSRHYSERGDLVGTPEQQQNAQQYIIDSLLSVFDRYFLPHVGTTSESRYDKIRYYGHMIHRMLLVGKKIIPTTDRDTYVMKRAHTAGISYSKIFKTHYNAAFIQAVKKSLRDAIRSTPFGNINLAQVVRGAINGREFERSLVQAITSSDGKINIQHRTFSNNMSAQILHRKNEANVLGALRQINSPSTKTASKQSARAKEIRAVHSSTTGYICPVRSADTGEKVGMQKGMAVSMGVTSAGNSMLLRERLLGDRLIKPLRSTSPTQIYDQDLSKVFVNGYWIGCTSRSRELVRKYRDLRRLGDVDKYTTIQWDTQLDEVQFWVDAGRVVRPLLIVYNSNDDMTDALAHRNRKDAKRTRKVKWRQGIGLTAKMLQQLYTGELSVADLVKMRIIEYISAEEQPSCYVSAGYNVLDENVHNELRPFTHCEIPQATFGILAHLSVYAQHNQTPRVVFETNQGKQTCSWFATNYDKRIDKDAFLQYYCDTPTVKTLTNDFIMPNGSNATVAVMLYGGFNQEDSLVFNQSALDRGLFSGCAYTSEKTEVEKGESIATPTPIDTANMKAYANYDKLVNGVVPNGTVVHKGDVIIGKRMVVKDAEKPYIDRSMVYDSNESAIVEKTVIARNNDDVQFCKVKLRSVRNASVGDKFSIPVDGEILTRAGWTTLRDITLEDEVATLNPETHALEWHNPTGKNLYEFEGDLYQLRSQQVDITCTLNHKLYVKKRNADKFERIDASYVMGKRVRFKKDAFNTNIDISKKILPAHNIRRPELTFDMDDWLIFLGIFIADGCLLQDKDKKIKLSGGKPRKVKQIAEVCERMGLHVIRYPSSKEANIIYCIQIFKELEELNVGALNKYLPDYVWDLSERQSRILLNALISCDGSYTNSGSAGYYTSSIQLADDVQQLALQAGWSGNITIAHPAGHVAHLKDGRVITSQNDGYAVRIVKSKNTPQINHGHCHSQNGQTEKLVHYNGTLGCIDVPNHIFYYRENGKPVWIGNSSRAGQKGIIGMTYPDIDMPRTRNGIAPDIIMNSHAMPSRMTVGQFVEGVVSKVCSIKGHITDGTAFTQIDIDNVCDTLEKLGFDRHGNETLINGMTGEEMEVAIFITPTQYQRLQKFGIKELNAVSSGPTDAITRQPVDSGKKKGLRLGEMERDVLTAAGAMSMLNDKFYRDSDHFKVYLCSNCGSRENVVVNRQKSIYRCKRCLDNANIVAIDASWTTKLLSQEMRAMGVGMRYDVEPKVFES